MPAYLLRYFQLLVVTSFCFTAARPQGRHALGDQGPDTQGFGDQGADTQQFDTQGVNNQGPNTQDLNAQDPEAQVPSALYSELVGQNANQAPPVADEAVAAGAGGEWGPLIQFPLIPVQAAVVPGAGGRTTEILTFSSYADFKFGGLGEPPMGYTQSAWYNIETGQIRHATVDNTGHDMFCPGMSHDLNGRIFVTGGNNAEVTSVYDFASAAWAKAPNMNIARGYHSTVITSNGDIFAIGGSFSGGYGGVDGTPLKNGEVFRQDTGTWDMLPGADVRAMLTVDAQGAYRTDNHGWLHTWLDGWIFQAGPSTAMNWYDTKGQGQVQPAGRRTAGFDQMNGMSVMFDVGQILCAGGAQDYGFSDAFDNGYIVTIGAPGEQVQVQPVAPMNYRRVLANAAVLPDGTVLVTGGQTYSELFTNNNATLNAELFDPRTGTWTILAAEQNPRTYHSTSLLLPDGRVMTGGGGLCWDKGTCDPAADHPDAQIFTPPYLLRGDQRPVIGDMQFPDGGMGSYLVPVGATFSATLQNPPVGEVTFSIVRLGSATHSVNTDQRRVPLIPVGGGQDGVYNFKIDERPGVVSPGFWYFFAMDDGVPSVSRTIQIK